MECATSFKVIFTTRCNLAADYYADRVLTLSKLSMDECKKLYYAHSGYDADNDCVESIIEMVDYNTLVFVLLAETMRKAGKSPEEILSILEKQELDQEQALVFHEYDYSAEEIEEYNKINSHLNVIFDISSTLTAVYFEHHWTVPLLVKLSLWGFLRSIPDERMRL